jgi:hypothetical protein
VCPTIIRQRFNALDPEGRVASGEWFKRDNPTGFASATSGEPPSTRSVIRTYVDTNWRVVAKAHFYRRPDASIGASGRPDPKFLVADGEAWVPDGDPAHRCPDCAPARAR